ncbi:GIY-YIG nuclease family protein [Dactylosporangium maewongense]|uniref:GIY-YIG nuclease family protein n=1 Tax=Dactylosporangium maewongense TaxID=634393 RepID=UPI0031DC091D
MDEVFGVPEPAVVVPQTDPEAVVGPVRPTDAVREEITGLLEQDDSRLGAVYRARRRGLTPDEVAAELQVATSGFVWNVSRTIKALVEGDLPTAPTVALAVSRKFRSILRSSRLSSATRMYLEVNLTELERRSNDEGARVVEARQAQEQTEQAESQNLVGIYVYALPHYLRYPFDPESGRTLMKVGRSDSDVIVRFRNQTRITALPEEPLLLRIYRTDSGDAPSVESDYHRLLEAADHYRSVARTAGREWFVTSLRFLDEVARVMRLPIVVVNEAADEG